MDLRHTLHQRGPNRGATALQILLVALLAVVLTAPSSSRPAAAATDLYVSDEVFATESDCTDQGLAAAPIRVATEALDDAWRAGSVGVGATEFHMVDIPDPADANQVDSHPTPMRSGASGVAVEVSHRQITSAESLSSADSSYGDVEPAGYRDPYTPAWGASTSSRTLQDCAPRPQFLYDGATQPQPRQWNALYGASTDLNAVMFEFPAPVRAFGAWFGDLETRTDGEGVPARVKLFDSAGSVVRNEALPTVTADQANGCGGSDTDTDQLGCGNQATRWVGFANTEPVVAAMLVVVGDDDTCNTSLPNSVAAGECDAYTERLSWIGATIALAPATLAVTKDGPVAPQQPGSAIEFTIGAHNPSDVDLDAVTIRDPLPPGLSLTGYDADGWTCTATGNELDCSLDSPLGPGTAAPAITIETSMAGDARPGQYLNRALGSWTAGTVHGDAADDHPIEVVLPPSTTTPTTVPASTTVPPTTAMSPTTAPVTTPPTTIGVVAAPNTVSRGAETLPSELAATGAGDLLTLAVMLSTVGAALSGFGLAVRRPPSERVEPEPRTRK